MKKLSELKDKDILVTEGGTVLSKEDLLEDLEFYKGGKVYTTTMYKAHIDAMYMLDSAFECEYQEMYEDWYESVMEDITEDDIKDIQTILDKILERNKERNICYREDEEVEIDMK